MVRLHLWSMLCLGLVFLVLTPLAVTSAKSDKIKCSQKEFETLFNQLIVVGNSGRKFPENTAQLDQFCRDTNILLPKFDKYKKQCLTETIKNIVSVLVYSLRTQMKRICSKKRSPRVTALIGASSCINRNSDKVGKCMDKMSKNFAGIKLAPNELKMPHICCQYVELMKCFSVVMRKNNCENKLPILEDQIHNVMGNFIDSSCGEYNSETDKCDHIAPVPKAKSASTSFVHNLVDIFNNIQQ